MTVKNCMARSDAGGFIGRKCRKPFKPKTMKINAIKYRAMVEAIFIAFSFVAPVLYAMRAALEDLRCLNVEIRPCPRREPGRLLPGYSVCERNSIGRIRTQVGMRFPVTEHLGNFA